MPSLGTLPREQRSVWRDQAQRLVAVGALLTLEPTGWFHRLSRPIRLRPS
jgi:hypothetical protein